MGTGSEGITYGERVMSKDFDEWRESIRAAGGNAWDNVADPIRELRIIRGEPIEWAEKAIAEFEVVRDQMREKHEYEAARVARMAMEKFRELLNT